MKYAEDWSMHEINPFEAPEVESNKKEMFEMDFGYKSHFEDMKKLSTPAEQEGIAYAAFVGIVAAILNANFTDTQKVEEIQSCVHAMNEVFGFSA